MFRRTPINAELKQTVASKGVIGVVMAAGPPNDDAVGFTPGWREESPEVAALALYDLPWKHLLSHLL